MGLSYDEIVIRGKYYYPATSHYYGKDTLLTRVVECDRCHKKNIPACIGLDDADLCLECAAIIIKLVEDRKNNRVIIKEEPENSDSEEERSLMCSDQFGLFD
jgi:hypothetical protein